MVGRAHRDRDCRVAALLAMTLLERALLPERPAFFITAGQRGGGKTTLVNMITLAALGRRAAAAGWSQNGEERRKALFSYLRQGVACLAWDNISRGAAISCPHIEAALTSFEVSDRVLGFSQVETVPSVTVQVSAQSTKTLTLNDKTTFEKSGQAAQASDLKVGDRVVIDVPKGKTEALLIKFGAPPAKKGS